MTNRQVRQSSADENYWKQIHFPYYIHWPKDGGLPLYRYLHQLDFRKIPVMPRLWATRYLQKFAYDIKQCISPDSLIIGAITDTHIKFTDSNSYYGFNGLQHIMEFLVLNNFVPLDLLVHLGDIIDGSDDPFIDQQMLQLVTTQFVQQDTPFLIAKGNHDEHDKYDEHTWLQHATFTENTFFTTVWQKMYQQQKIKYLSRNFGVSYFDKANMRVVLINTCDVPYKVDETGKKQYDHKLVMGLRQQQLTEIIAILENSEDKQILVLGHGNLIKSNGQNALQYNGKALHDLLKAFNAGLAGRLQHEEKDDNFSLDLQFDFRDHGSGRVLAYICGHRHIEDQFTVDGIAYILLNVSALMGNNHGLTTMYNRSWNRKKDKANEFAGYVIALDPNKHTLNLFGYGAASFWRQISF
ncbi:metallophosphoesterase family protein [Bombilactobacillus thymidiniphilus]|uniref:Metallophosphoesterase n=1 Tax=Bombilactobacillus thymidiniphilus TaxID=2923363 RepID=A0ABY4PC17_9LACO|nr:metallophosphoesterase [Bombilactobacillus thymidiniphilus]UQS83086.1 metallophosphoesterase [Bombilactobacillus thymidiniphilus]